MSIEFQQRMEATRIRAKEALVLCGYTEYPPDQSREFSCRYWARKFPANGLQLILHEYDYSGINPEHHTSIPEGREIVYRADLHVNEPHMTFSQHSLPIPDVESITEIEKSALKFIKAFGLSEHLEED